MNIICRGYKCCVVILKESCGGIFVAVLTRVLTVVSFSHRMAPTVVSTIMTANPEEGKLNIFYFFVTSSLPEHDRIRNRRWLICGYREVHM